jgi:beta-aspartyl-peptidase (threonine type)
MMLAEAQTLPDGFRAELRALCLTPDGRHGGAAGQAGSTYNVMTSTSADVEVRARVEL